MEMGGWSDDAVAGAASAAGAEAAAARMGLPPGQAAGVRAAAQAELGKRGKRRGKTMWPRKPSIRMPCPPAILRDLMRDPLTLGALSVLVTALRMVTRPRRSAPLPRTPVPRPPKPPRPRNPDHLPEPDFPSAAGYDDRADYVSAVGAWMSDPAVRARIRADGIHSYGVELWDEVGGKLEADDERRSRAI